MENKFPNNEPEAQKNEDNEQPKQQLNASTINGAQDYIADGGVKVNINCNNMYADASFVEAFNKWLDGKKKGVKEEVVKKEVEEVKEEKVEAASVLPPKLKTPKAFAIWKALQEAGYIKKDFMPADNLTMGMAAYIAKWMSGFLGIRNYWKLFGALWGYSSKKMSIRLCDALGTKKIHEIIDGLKRIEAELKLNVF